jgi:Uma2 family endonuclease
VEVLSPDTQDYDLGEKFDHYQRIPSLEAVLFVWQTEPRMELRTRAQDGSFSASSFGPGSRVTIEPLGCSLVLDDVYRDAEAPG